MTTRRVVLGYDGSEGSKAAAAWCLKYAAALDAEIIAVGVVDLVPLIGLPPAGSPVANLPVDAMETAMRDKLERGVAPLRAAGIPCRTLVKTGNPAAVLDRVAQEEPANLIVVGRRGRGGFAEMLLGSVPHSLSHHASRPVVIVPAARSFSASLGT